MITTLLYSMLTLTMVQTQDSISHAWLEKEWNELIATEQFMPEKAEKIYLVTMDGSSIVSFDKHELTSGNLLTEKERAYYKSDFLFDLDGDEYYLLPVINSPAQSSGTVRYSSAE